MKWGRQKRTQRRTIEKELSEMHLTWEEAQKVVNDREKWRHLVVTPFKNV